MPALRRPLPVALMLAIFAQLLFCWRLSQPGILVFDEIYYVPAARTLLALSHPVNIEHPLVGKMLIAGGIALLGDGPLGWRLPSTLAAITSLLAIFAILQMTFGCRRTSVIGALLALLNFTLFVQARIAMLDGFMAAFVLGAATMIVWAIRSEGPRFWWRWSAAAVLLGLAIGTKWTALPCLGFAGLTLIIRGWRRPSLVPALIILVLVSSVTYLATFAPAFFYAHEPMTPASLLPFQLEMYRQQTQILPAHLYQSAWWSWPIDLRPIWYLYERVDGAQRGVLMIGNPVVMLGGLIAVMACMWGWWRGDRRLGATAMLWAGSWLMWALIPKSLGFFYYYYLSSLWLPIVIAAALHRFDSRFAERAVLLLAAVFFAYFYPILSAAPLPGVAAFRYWAWLPSWV